MKEIIQQTATRMSGRAAWEVGAGYVNAYAAVERALRLAGFGPMLSPTHLDFGTVEVRITRTDSVTVTNTGTASLIISSVTSDNDEFGVSSTSATVAPSSNQRFYVSFDPISEGYKFAGIIFTHNASTSPDRVEVAGIGRVVATAIEASDTSVATFGGWHRVDDERATNGFYYRNVGADKSGSRAYIEFGFNGSRIDLQIATGPRGGVAEVFIDGVSQGRVDFCRPPSDPSKPDNSGKKDLTFDHSVSYTTSPGEHTFRLAVLNDTPDPKRNMIYVDGFVIYGESSNSASAHSESSTTNGTAQPSAGTTGETHPAAASPSTVLLTAVIETNEESPLNVLIVNPLGGLVEQRTVSDPVAIIRWVPSTIGTYSVVLLNNGIVATPYTLYLVKTEELLGGSSPKQSINQATKALQDVPSAFALGQNFQNPFNPSTTIRYSIPLDERVTLKIYNALGQEIRTLVHQWQSAGAYSVSFKASDLPSGMYFYRIAAGPYSKSVKMSLVK